MRIPGAVILSSLLFVTCGISAPPSQSQQPSPESPPAAAGKPAAPVSAQGVDACSLFSKSEIEALLEQPVSDGRKEDLAELSVCRYESSKTPASALLSLSIFTGSRPGQAKGAYDIGKRNAGGVEAVSGLGDEAYWDKLLATLNVLKGNYELEVTVASDGGGLKTARAVAERAVAKLPQDGRR